MITFDWNAAYELKPTTSLSRSVYDDALRQFSRGIRERMEVEHEWGPSSDLDDGRHKRGLVTVMLQGDEGTMNALTNMQEGSLFLLEQDGFLKLMVYTSSAWVMVGADHHDALSGLADHDHPQYLQKSGGTMTGELDCDGSAIVLPNSDDAIQCGLVAGKHLTALHSGNVDTSVFDGKLPLSKTTITPVITKYTFTISSGGGYHWETMPASPYIGCPSMVFAPDSTMPCDSLRLRYYSGVYQFGFGYSAAFPYGIGDYIVKFRSLT